MPYNPSTDFVGLWRNISGGSVKGEMPGKDYVVAALNRAGIMNVAFTDTAPVADQANTAWFKTATPSSATEGTLYLWDGATYVPASPALFSPFVRKTGDVMTGNLIVATTSGEGSIVIAPVIPGTASALYLKKPADTNVNIIYGMTGSTPRWAIVPGDSAVETGANAGSNFDIIRYSDDGIAIDYTLQINRASGLITTAGSVGILGSVSSGYGAAIGNYFFGNTGSKFLQYDGTVFNLVGGPLHVLEGIVTATSSTNGVIQFGTAGGATLAYNGANYIISGGEFTVIGYAKAIGHACRSGVAGAYDSNYFNLNYTGAVALWVGAVNMGNITLTSDYRIKKDILNLPGMWDTVKKLRPIQYTQAEFSPQSHIDYIDKTKSEGGEVPIGPMFEADNIERWGFIAHELQEAMTPSAAFGMKDSPDTIQSPNPMTLIAALTKALQEAMTRIEALELTAGAAK